MFRKPEVLRDYNRGNPLNRVLFGNNVVVQLNDNITTFPPTELPVSTMDLTAACNDLLNKYNEYKQGGPSKKEAYVAALLVFVTKFNLTADYVELVAHEGGANAGTIIQLAGFHVTKTETDPSEIPGEPDSKMLSGTMKGSVKATTKPIKGVKGYLFAVGTPDFTWTKNGNQVTFKLGNSFASFIIGTKREVEFQSLPSFIDAKAAAAAFNAAGLGDFNEQEVSIP